jgi:DNA-binding IclR family transcriptional regulator
MKGYYMASTRKATISLWDEVYQHMAKAGKRGVTSDEIVQATGYNPHTVSSYLSYFVQGGYATKTDRRRAIRSGREATVYAVK